MCFLNNNGLFWHFFTCLHPSMILVTHILQQPSVTVTVTVTVPISYVMVGVFSSLHSFMFRVLRNPAFSPSGLYVTLLLYHRVLCNPLLLYLGLCTLPSSCACTMQLRNPATPFVGLCTRYSFMWDCTLLFCVGLFTCYSFQVCVGPCTCYSFIWDYASATSLYGTMYLPSLYSGTMQPCYVIFLGTMQPATSSSFLFMYHAFLQFTA